MVIALVAHVDLLSSTYSIGGTSAAIDTTGSNLGLIGLSYYGGDYANFTSVTDSKGNTWIPLTARTGADSGMQLFYCLNPTVGSGHTFTLTVSGILAGSIFVAFFSGVASYDQESGTTVSGSSSIQPGSLTAASANSLYVSAFGSGFGSSGSQTVDSSFTITDTIDFTSGQCNGGSLAYKISSAAENPTWSIVATGGASIAAAMAIFAPAASGTVTPTQYGFYQPFSRVPVRTKENASPEVFFGRPPLITVTPTSIGFYKPLPTPPVRTKENLSPRVFFGQPPKITVTPSKWDFYQPLPRPPQRTKAYGGQTIFWGELPPPAPSTTTPSTWDWYQALAVAPRLTKANVGAAVFSAPKIPPPPSWDWFQPLSASPLRAKANVGLSAFIALLPPPPPSFGFFQTLGSAPVRAKTNLASGTAFAFPPPPTATPTQLGFFQQLSTGVLFRAQRSPVLLQGPVAVFLPVTVIPPTTVTVDWIIRNRRRRRS